VRQPSTADVIADVMRAATGADIAFMNPGGIRAQLVAKHAGRGDQAVTYGDAFEVLPFQDTLMTMALTGAEIRTLLEQQFGSGEERPILQVSNGFTYHYAYDHGSRKGTVSDEKLRGKALVAEKRYHVTVNSFLAAGGDGFAVLTAGEATSSGRVDVDALAAYLRKTTSSAAPLAPPAATRIVGDGCK
jgi:5'-nucleotidase